MASKPGSGTGKTGALFLVGAIIMAIVTAMVFNSAVKGNGAKKPKPPETEPVIVAAQYIPAGSALTGAHLKRLPWPKAYLSPDSYFTRASDVMGRTVRGDLLPGEIIYKQKLAGEKSRGGLPVMIPEGKRAVAISVNEVKSVAGFVKPGDHVDVIATFVMRNPGDEESPTDKLRLSRTVLQNVLVLATAQTMINPTEPRADKPPALVEAERDPKAKPGEDKDKKKSPKELEREQKQREKAQKDAEKRAKTTSSVTLALTPQEAEQAALLEEASEIHLTLRGEGDTKLAPVASAESRQLILGAGPGAPAGAWPFGKAPRPPADGPSTNVRPAKTVELIQGASKSTVSF